MDLFGFKRRNAEKKELRKIEQKPSIEICPHSIKSKSYLETGYPVEQNSSWSEEDERMINSIIKNLDEGEWFDIYQADWLKSLKERVQPQNK